MKKYKYNINDLPLYVEYIKNLNQFLRDITDQEQDTYWKNMLKDVYFCSTWILNRNESPLQRKRKVVQSYLDYKNDYALPF